MKRAFSKLQTCQLSPVSAPERKVRVRDALTKTEIEILRRTADDGHISLADFQMGEFLFLGGGSLPEDLNKYTTAEAAHYIEGLKLLERHGLVTYKGEQQYILTGRGFDIRKELLDRAV
jgi:hypothetical protein